MCGVLGQVCSSGIDQNEFNERRDTLQHRGPDSAGSWFSENREVALGHRRLSLLDLSESGHQPMTNESGSIWLTFNGEIYNYIELRKELERSEHVFRSQSDSEVIIHGYEEWGVGVLSRLKGMFAFGIWDEGLKKMLLARDRFGIKPLYYWHSGSELLFASELKAIVSFSSIIRTVDYSAVADFLTYRYVPSPKTIWKGVSKLPPAHYLEFSVDGSVKSKKYWELTPGDEFIEEDKLVADIDQRILDSVKIHARSDVAVGSFLSSGYDSSALVSYLSQLGFSPSTFSIGFPDWEESEDAIAASTAQDFKLKNYSTTLKPTDLRLLEKLSYYYDEPLADISTIPCFKVAQLAQTQTKAVLSGEGADEIFVGYNWQRELSGISSGQMIPYYANAMAMGLFDDYEIREILSPDLHSQLSDNSNWFYEQNFDTSLSSLKACQVLDIQTFMSELVLTKVDRASMANSLEVRVPFLDHELVERMLSVNESQYYKTHVTKFILHSLIKGRVSQSVLERKKQGFVGPDAYYRKYDWFAMHLRDGELVRSGIIYPPTLERYIEDRDHWRLWKLLVLEMWFRTWV